MCSIFTVKDLKMLEMMTGSFLKKLSAPGNDPGNDPGNEPGLEIDPGVFKKLLASDGATNDTFGTSVAVSADGSTVVVGATGDDDKGSNSGSAYIFTKQANGSYLQTQKLLASDGAAGDRFGHSVAVSGDGLTVVAGAYQDDDKGSNSGSAYIFTKQADGSYLETQKLLATDGAANDRFGSSVAVTADGLTVVAGAYQDDDKGSNSGSVYIFTKQANGSYLETQKLVASDGAMDDYFGWSVAVSGDGSTVVVGSYKDDDKGTDSGSAYIFTKQADGSYLETQKLLATDGAAGDRFGYSVAVSGDGSTVVVGATGDDDKGADTGSVYIFTKEVDGSYFETHKLLATGGRSGEEFGWSVAVSRDGSTVVVGAHKSDTSVKTYGAAYTFTKQPDKSYLQTHKLSPPGYASSNHFGKSVAISNTSVAVAANANGFRGVVYVY